jgi:leucyl/phenylalanyl-tRNA--protein transferase
MPVYLLGPDPIFPPVGEAEPDGLLAVGGDLRPARLLAAYASGIFPWYSEGSPILWWSPDPRLILRPREVRVSRSLRQRMKNAGLTLTLDRDFQGVIRSCASAPRTGADTEGGGTWITPEMAEAYTALHRMGHAHSVEAWRGDALVGGLYGVSVGRAFFGESMFCLERDTSKAALVKLCERLGAWGYGLIDCQMTTPHLIRMGAREIPRAEFCREVAELASHEPDSGAWAGCGPDHRHA